MHLLFGDMSRWKCVYCAKVLEGESFMSLVKGTRKEGEPIHAWKNITLLEEPELERDKLLA
jgi:hypothetical protein